MLFSKKISQVSASAIMAGITVGQIAFANFSDFSAGKAMGNYNHEIGKTKVETNAFNNANKINFLVSAGGINVVLTVFMVTLLIHFSKIYLAQPEIDINHLIVPVRLQEIRPFETGYQQRRFRNRIFLNKLRYYYLANSAKEKITDFVSRIAKKEVSKALAKGLVSYLSEYLHAHFSLSIPGGSVLVRKALSATFKVLLSEAENYIKKNLDENVHDKHMPIKKSLKEKILKKVKEKVFLTASGIEYVDDTIFDTIKQKIVDDYYEKDNFLELKNIANFFKGVLPNAESYISDEAAMIVKRTLWGETLGRLLNLNQFEDWIVEKLEVTK